MNTSVSHWLTAIRKDNFSTLPRTERDALIKALGKESLETQKRILNDMCVALRTHFKLKPSASTVDFIRRDARGPIKSYTTLTRSKIAQLTNPTVIWINSFVCNRSFNNCPGELD